jgi:putative hydrolase of the HAD superfamily
MYSITQTNWTLEDDAPAALQKLKSKGYHLGIFSNAGDDKDVQQLIESFGVRPHFDFVLTSAACYYRKPHARAFEIALAQWNISPGEAVMVGDTLMADIYGAHQLGMQTIWLTRRAQFNADEELRVQPDFSLRDLDQLYPTLEQINLMRG